VKSQPSQKPDLSAPASGTTSSTSLRHVTMTNRTALHRPEAGPDAVDPYVGATIDGRYEVETLIGEGGMGVVYRCTHTIIGKKVAMKVLRADMARSEEVVGRFLNEARAASSIGNPHIIDISDFGRLPDGATYFIMEYLEGTALSAAAEGGTLGLDRVGPIVIQLAEALAAAHDAGIVHRDLKPENIFLVRRGSQRDFVKVLDFGIAKVANAQAGTGRLTQAGAVFGTPHYMSPEQAAGTAVDHRADIYAVGVILYELVTGRLPFDAETFMGILSQHMYKEPEPPSTLIQFQRLDPDLERVILCCLKKNPDDRYQRMSELEADLRLVFGDSGAQSRPELRATAMSGTLIVEEPPPKRRVWPLVLLALVGVLGALGYFYRGVLGGPPRAALEASAQKPPATPPPAPAAPLPTFVAVAVDPLSAHVFRGEHDLGSSPVMIEMGKEPLQLVAKAAGFLPQAFIVDGTVTKISVRLEPLDAPAKAPAVRPATKSSARPPKQTGRSTGASSKKSTEGSGELVNPWD